MKKPKSPPEPAVTAYWAEFRKRLVALREEELDWTQEVMAEMLGIPWARYQKYETRDKFPLHLVPKLARLTHRDVEFIVTGRVTKPTVVRSRVA